MIIRAVACDLEGTLVDVEWAHHGGHLATATEFGLYLSLEEAYTKIPHFIGGPDEKVCEDILKLLRGHPEKRPTVAQILERDKFHYNRLLKQGPPADLRRGVSDTLIAMEKLGLGVAVGSLTPTEQATTLLEGSGLTRFFPRHRIVLREDVANPKPAPDVFLETARRLNVRPEEQLVFEDSPNGIRAAIAAGSRAIGMPVVHRPETVSALVQAGAVRIFHEWGEMNVGMLIQNLNNRT